LCLASTPHCPASLFVVPPDPDHPALHSFPTRRSSISLREEHKNRVTQLFVRTGQPGMAPERTVLDRYDINGYFTKVEATEDKLRSEEHTSELQSLTNLVCRLLLVRKHNSHPAALCRRI